MKAPKLPTKRVFGPIARTRSWGRMRHIAQWALWFALQSAGTCSAEYLDYGFSQFFDQASDELLAATDAPDTAKGKRGKRIQCSWKPLIEPSSVRSNSASVEQIALEQHARQGCDIAANALDYCIILDGVAEAIADTPDEVPTLLAKLVPVCTSDERVSSLVHDLSELTHTVSGLVVAGTPDGREWAGCRRARSEGLVTRARGILAEAKKVSDECNRTGFRDWLRGNGAGDSKAAFQFSRLPSQWCPDPVNTKEAYSHDAIGRLDAERAKYGRLWQASDVALPSCEEGMCAWCEGQPSDDGVCACSSAEVAGKLPPLAADILREASRSFSHGTFFKL